MLHPIKTIAYFLEKLTLILFFLALPFLMIKFTYILFYLLYSYNYKKIVNIEKLNKNVLCIPTPTKILNVTKTSIRQVLLVYVGSKFTSSLVFENFQKNFVTTLHDLYVYNTIANWWQPNLSLLCFLLCTRGCRFYDFT